MTEEEPDGLLEDRSPIFGSWKVVYIVVVANLLTMVGVLYLVTRWAS